MYQTQVVNSDGTCCDCSQQMDCKCAGGARCSYGCRSRSSSDGTASFCGFAEYIASDPPEFYLMKSLSGGVGLTTWGNASCAGISGEVSYGYSGAATYDKKTCVLTTNAGVNFAPGGFQDRSDVETEDLGSFGYPIGVSDLFTPTSHDLPISCFCGAGDCCCKASGFACANCASGSAGTAALGDKESYEDAIDRAVGDRPWSIAGDCIAHASYTSFVPAGQRYFLFQQGQVKALVGGQPGKTYQVVILLSEKAFGSDAPLTPYGQLETSITCTPSGVCESDWIDVPNEEGLFIAATGCTLTESQ